MSYVPDMTERFPEGRDGVDLTSDLLGEVGSYDDHYEQGLNDEFEEHDPVAELMDYYEVDEATAKEIEQLNRITDTFVIRMRYSQSQQLDDIMVKNGYPSITETELPF